MDTSTFKAVIGEGKTVTGMLLILLGTWISITGYPKEAEQLLSIGQVLMGIGIGARSQGKGK